MSAPLYQPKFLAFLRSKGMEEVPTGLTRQERILLNCEFIQWIGFK